MRLVYYSLVNFPDDSREHQWIQSIRSLRRHNPSIPVWLLLFNHRSSDLLREAERQNVHVRYLGDYAEFMEHAHPRGLLLALYPTFHKFLVLRGLPLEGFSQILYLDCDTFFFNDVNLLFDLHASSDWYAREEMNTLRSHLPCDPKHVDELLLHDIASREGLRYVAPFNSGVCLLNNRLWESFEGLQQTYLSMAWRLICGRELSGYDFGPHHRRVHIAVMNAITDSDRVNALPYPSRNDWIIEQIALWLALGSLPNSPLGTLSPEHVLQGGEFENILASDRRCVLAHYFSVCESDFFAAVPKIE